MILETAVVLGCPLILGTLIGIVLRRRSGRRYAGVAAALAFVILPIALSTVLTVSVPLVGLCLDTGHLMLGGGDPLEIYRRHAARVWHVHFKDFEPRVFERTRGGSWNYFESMRQGIFCELGRGAVDFAAPASAFLTAL